MPKISAEEKPQDNNRKQGISNRNLEEENRRQAKVIPFPEKREEKPASEREKK